MGWLIWFFAPFRKNGLFGNIAVSTRGYSWMNTSGARKNLVLIHLESISNLTLWQYRVELSTVWEMLRRSRYFSRFYVSATSSLMSKNSLVVGDDSINDQLSRYASGGQIVDALCRSTIYDDFMHNGYVFDKFFLVNLLGQRFATDYFPTLNMRRSSYADKLLGVFRSWLEGRRRNGENFLVHFDNDVTHMASDDDLKIQAETVPDRFHIAYQALDASIGALIAILREFGFLENTVLAFYGDHGDELWTHSLARGYAHGIAPYSNLVWTPMFLYNNGKNAGVTTELTSITDLREMLLKMALPGVSHDQCLANVRQSPFSGIDHTQKARELAFSQNLYALQVEYGDIEQALTKAYAVTDGVYRLVASSAGKRVKEGGLEFYYERLDPTNGRNLLDFFNLGNNGDIISIKPFSTIGDRTFPLLFTADTIQNMIDAYHHLKHELYAYVRAKEAEAIRHNGGERHIMPENAFRFSRKRLRHDYLE